MDVVYAYWAENVVDPLEIMPIDESLVVLAREVAWFEDYAKANPYCAMSRIYLDYLRREYIHMQGDPATAA